MGYYYELTHNQSLFVPAARVPALNESVLPILAKEYADDPIPEGIPPFEHLAGQGNWSVYYDDAGNLTGLSHAESKHIDDGILQYLAPFAENGGFIEVKGEDDDDLFRWVIIDGDVVTINPEIRWDMELDHLRQLSAEKLQCQTEYRFIIWSKCFVDEKEFPKVEKLLAEGGYESLPTQADQGVLITPRPIPYVAQDDIQILRDLDQYLKEGIITLEVKKFGEEEVQTTWLHLLYGYPFQEKETPTYTYLHRYQDGRLMDHQSALTDVLQGRTRDFSSWGNIPLPKEFTSMTAEECRQFLLEHWDKVAKGDRNWMLGKRFSKRNDLETALHILQLDPLPFA